MLVVNRFRVPQAESLAFEAQAAALVALLAPKPGAQQVDLVRNLDDPQLWALVGRWSDVGSYRRGLGGYETKLAWMHLMGYVVDEPSAYVSPDELGSNLPRERY